MVIICNIINDHFSKIYYFAAKKTTPPHDSLKRRVEIFLSSIGTLSDYFKLDSSITNQYSSAIRASCTYLHLKPPIEDQDKQ